MMSGATSRFSLAAAAGLAIIFGAISYEQVQAIQPDAAFVERAEKNREKWKAEDEQVTAKLEALEKRFGKRPNIIYILADDVGWGEPGCYLGGELRGTPTPTLDRMAREGMKFLQAYAEPSCTPTRLAINTGRHPVRTGCNSVLWPGGPTYLGLHPQEKTVAEVLSEAGYHTAMWGKWHLGDTPEMAPENQGYDYAHYGLFNGAVWGWLGVESLYNGKVVPGAAHWYDFPGVKAYEEKYGIHFDGYLRGVKGEGRKETGQLTSPEDMTAFEDLSIKEIIEFVKKKGKSDKPFFVYWATYCQQVASSPLAYRHNVGVDHVNNQAAELAQHNDHLDLLLGALEEQGIAENTLIVWYSDNGPMYGFYPNAGFSYLRGEKGEVLEGGVRVPAIAHWPGMIEPDQAPTDLIHVVDLFTTAARLGGAIKNIPNDRVTDGIDQTALLLLGKGHGRRDYAFYYSGPVLGAARMGDFKMHILPGGGHGGLPGMEFYNIIRDPREEHGEIYPFLFLVTPFQSMIADHQQMIERFPNRVLKPQ